MNIWTFAVIICWHGCYLGDTRTIRFIQENTCLSVTKEIYNHNLFEMKFNIERCQPKGKI